MMDAEDALDDEGAAQLARSLGRLRPQVDIEAALADVHRATLVRRLHQRLAVASAAAVVLVLVIGTLAFGGGADDETVIMTNPAGSSSTLPATTFPRSTIRSGDGEVVGTTPPGSSTSVSPATVTAPGILPSSTIGSPPPTIQGSGSLVIELHPSATIVTLDDDLVIDVTVRNETAWPVSLDDNGCRSGVVRVRLGADPPSTASPTDEGPSWDGDRMTLASVLVSAGSGSRNRFATWLGSDHAVLPTPIICTLAYVFKTLAPGESFHQQVHWSVRLAPGDPPPNDTLYLSGTTLPIPANVVPVAIRVVDDPLRSQPLQPVVDALFADPLAEVWLAAHGGSDLRVMSWFHDGQWVIRVHDPSGWGPDVPAGAEFGTIQVAIDAATNTVVSVDRIAFGMDV